MVGIGTVKSDNPSLSTRLVTAGPQGSSITHPRPIIIDPHFETPIQSKFISRSPILLGIRENDKSSKLESKGACIVLIPVLDSGKMDMSFAMQLLYSKYGISSIMVEGGASVIAQFLTSYDRLFVTISPQFLSRGIRVAAPKGLISDAQYHIFGRDIVLESNIRMDTPAPLNVQTSQTAIIQNAYISFY